MNIKLRLALFVLSPVLLAAMSCVGADSPAMQAPPAASTQVAPAADGSTRFLRFVDGPEARLEAASITYRNAAGVQVRLVSAVHIGEPAYFRAIQKSFVQDDAVLYEMVKPRGSPPPQPGQHGDHAVTQLQTFLNDKLQLAYQLDAIDYRAANFVHADLDAETFAELQNQRGESMATLLMQSMSESLSRGGGGSGGDSTVELLQLVAAPDPPRQMKQLLGRQMNDIEAAVAGLEGPNGSVILTERNKEVIRTLEAELAKGHKRLGIYFGAAHMPDLDRRLRAKGFESGETVWILAWDAAVRKNQASMLQRWLGQAPATRPAK